MSKVTTSIATCSMSLSHQWEKLVPSVGNARPTNGKTLLFKTAK